MYDHILIGATINGLTNLVLLLDVSLRSYYFDSLTSLEKMF